MQAVLLSPENLVFMVKPMVLRGQKAALISTHGGYRYRTIVVVEQGMYMKSNLWNPDGIIGTGIGRTVCLLTNKLIKSVTAQSIPKHCKVPVANFTLRKETRATVQEVSEASQKHSNRKGQR